MLTDGTGRSALPRSWQISRASSPTSTSGGLGCRRSTTSWPSSASGSRAAVHSFHQSVRYAPLASACMRRSLPYTHDRLEGTQSLRATTDGM
jgi:hypothetical protein